MRLQQLQGNGANGARHRRPPHAIPTAADWAWAASVDLEEELLPGYGARQKRIPQAARGDLARALLLPLKRIVADHTDEGAWALFLLFPILVLGRLVRGGSAGLRNLKERCRRFESGDWEGLLDDHHEAEDRLAEQFEEAERGSAQSAGEPTDEEVQARRIRRCLRLGRAGEFSRAARALESSRPAPVTEETVQTLRELHPAAPSPIPDWVDTFEPVDSFLLTAESLHTALDTSPRDVSGGPSGSVYEHYRDIFGDSPEAFVIFHLVCCLIARGLVPPRARAALSSCRLLAMAKPVDGGPDGVRPLAVGEVWHRLVARAVGIQCRERFREFFSPLQFGVSTPGGCEAVVAGIRACLDLEPETLVLQVDLANAFNEVDRVAMFDELRLHFPELLPFFRCFYAEPSRLLLRRDSGEWELLESQTGSRQGDPLAGFLFALAYHRPLSATHAAFPDVQLPSYADDTHIVGQPARAVQAFEHLQGGLASLSLRVKLAKCAAFSGAEIPPDLPIPPEFRRPPHGIVALGAPIGSAAHIHEVVGAKLQFFSEQLTTLPMLRDLQIALALLSLVFVQRPSYLMRTVAPSPEFRGQLQDYDGRVVGCLESLLGPDAFAGDAGELARRQVTLPTSLGGLGIRRTAAIAPAAFLGAWALVGSLVAGRFLRSGEPFLAGAVSDGVESGVLPFQIALRAARDLLPGQLAAQTLGALAEFGRGSVRGVQERVTAAIDLGAVQTLRDHTVDPAQRARLVSETGPGAAAWLSTAPLFPALAMEDECFRTALRTWLGLPHPMVAGIALCECGQSLQGPLGGQHLLRCTRGSERNDTHDGVRDTVASIMRESGFSVRMEQYGVMPIREGDVEGRRMDLVGADPRGGSRVLADVTVADPLREGLLPAAAVERGRAAREAALAKEVKYGDHPADDTFIPLAVETYGCLDSSFDEFLGTCARRAAELRMGGLDSAPMASRLLCYFRQRVSVSLQRSQARAVHHRAARAVERSVGLRAEVVQDGRVRTVDLHTLSRVGRS